MHIPRNEYMHNLKIREMVSSAHVMHKCATRKTSTYTLYVPFRLGPFRIIMDYFNEIIIIFLSPIFLIILISLECQLNCYLRLVLFCRRRYCPCVKLTNCLFLSNILKYARVIDVTFTKDKAFLSKSFQISLSICIKHLCSKHLVKVGRQTILSKYLSFEKVQFRF